MKILKRILIILAAIIAIPLLIAVFVKRDYSVEREITVNRPRNEVFDYIKYIRNQNKFSVWATMDPNMKQEFRGTDGTVGFVSAWDSPESGVGTGEQEIVGIQEGEKVDYELRFIKPFESKAKAYMSTEGQGQQTVVRWGFMGHSDYPFNFMNLFMGSMIGKDLEKGLVNLKNIMEKQ
jgi:hypothetical protein